MVRVLVELVSSLLVLLFDVSDSARQQGLCAVNDVISNTLVYAGRNGSLS